MSILEKILKNKKGGLTVQDESQNLSDKIILNNEIEITNHKKSVLEDGRLYDTSKAEKVFSDPTSVNCICFRTISGNPRQFNYRDESVELCISAH